MALKINSGQYGLSSLLKEGQKNFQGLEEAVFRNIAACKEMCSITASSLGPSGLNKLVVNQLDKIFLTNDAGTILRELEIAHPAARLILMASQQQEKEVGDGSNLVVVLAGEMLAEAEQLLRLGLSPSIIVEGFEAGKREALRLLEGETIPALKVAGPESMAELKAVIRTVVASKQWGREDTLADLITRAVQIALPDGNIKDFNVDNVRCAKIIGGAFGTGSYVVRGMILHREPESQVKRVENAKVAVYACPIGIGRTEATSTVLLQSAQAMLDFGKGEEALIEEQIRLIAESGVKAVVTGDQIGEIALHHLNRHGILTLRIQSKFELRRFCRATGSHPLARLGPPTPEEAGHVQLLESAEIGGQRMTIIKQAEDMIEARLATIVLRGSTPNQLDDLERAVEDGVGAARTALLRDGRVVAGAGAVELQLSSLLTAHGETTPGLLQYGIKAYAASFLAPSRILSTNAGHRPIPALARLTAAHPASPHTGVHLDDPEHCCLDAQAAGIVDLVEVKRSAIHLATEAALTVLRVDQIIMSKPAGGPKPRAPQATDNDD